MVVIAIRFTTYQIASKSYFLDPYKDKNAKLHNFLVVPTIVETAMEALPLLIIQLFSYSFSVTQCLAFK